MPKDRQDMIDYCRTLLGTPFHHQGRLPGVGLDCMGVLVCLAKFMGLPPHDLKNYPRNPDGQSIDRGLKLSLDTIPLKDAQPGDIFTFWIRRPGLVSHVALATDRGILHSVAEIGRVVEHSIDERWQKRVAVVYTLPGVSDYGRKFNWAFDPLTPPSEVVARIEPPAGCC